jgi:translation initiation factor 4G
MNICKEKPDNLPPLDVIGLEPGDTPSLTMSRGGSGRVTSGMSPRVNVRSASIGLGIASSGLGKSHSIGFQMGQFSTSAGKMSSEERFAAANSSASVSEGQLGGRPPTTVHVISPGGTGGRDRIRSKRGANGDGASAASNPGTTSSISNMVPPMEPVAPLEVSANCWAAGSTRCGSSSQDGGWPEVVDHIVKALLNQLTMEHFDFISDQIIVWANKSEEERDGRTLIQVVKLVFEKATDEATFSEMYAQLCRKMMEQISPKVQDDGIKNSEGKPFAGGNLFRNYLLSLCREEFERSPVAQEATTDATSQATADKAVKETNENIKGDEEFEPYSDEYYAAAKSRRRGLGLIRFIGELFKLQMLTERIMHECIKKLLADVENPMEDEIESLCMLLTTVGGLLDTPKARAHLDVYFSRMRELTKNKNVNERMVFILQVCIYIPCAYDIH